LQSANFIISLLSAASQQVSPWHIASRVLARLADDETPGGVDRLRAQDSLE
jgi:hypothetical protein